MKFKISYKAWSERDGTGWFVGEAVIDAESPEAAEQWLRDVSKQWKTAPFGMLVTPVRVIGAYIEWDKAVKALVDLPQAEWEEITELVEHERMKGEGT